MRAILAGALRKVALLVALLELDGCTEVAKAEQGVSATKSLSFAGHVWRVKASEKRVGPGPNYFSDSSENVWVDDGGRMHLKLTEREGRWLCAEVISEESFGLGTYRFELVTPLAKLDPNITLGLFTWSDASAYAHREIDVECGRWGKADDANNAQFVVQPYQGTGRLRRFAVPRNMEAVIYSFIWQSDMVIFMCIEEREVAPAKRGTVIQEWRFTKNPPVPGNENVRINLWLSAGRAPVDVNDTEVVISNFQFVPLPKLLPDGAHGDAP